MPLSVVQILEFELGSGCNLGDVHTLCPNRHCERYASLNMRWELDDTTIVSCAEQAYNALHFTGFIGWIYYNEPLLQADRMFRLMDEVRQAAPQARFMLWTNGTLIPEDCERFRKFEQILVSVYNEHSRRGVRHLRARHIHCGALENPQLDNRLQSQMQIDLSQPCLRPFVEFILDNHGNHHMCCYDWRGLASQGNVFEIGFAELVNRWQQRLPEIVGEEMTAEAPAACLACGHRWSRIQCHDRDIVARAKHFSRTLGTQGHLKCEST